MRGPLEPGTYSLRVWGKTGTSPLPRAVVEVPEGWYSDGGWVIDSGNYLDEPEQIGQISVWQVDRGFTDPCHPGRVTDPGPSVTDLVRAVGRQRGPSSPPRPIVLDGYPGLALEVTVPPAIDLRRCTADHFGQYALWRTRGEAVHAVDTAGVVNHLHVLDVEGTRLVVVVTAYPDQPNEQPTDLLAVAETITFQRPDS